jgi:hypothetical protein
MITIDLVWRIGGPVLSLASLVMEYEILPLSNTISSMNISPIAQSNALNSQLGKPSLQRRR